MEYIQHFGLGSKGFSHVMSLPCMISNACYLLLRTETIAITVFSTYAEPFLNAKMNFNTTNIVAFNNKSTRI